MDKKSQLFERIKDILDTANQVITTKKDIEKTILDTVSTLHNATGGKIRIQLPEPSDFLRTHGYNSSEKIIRIDANIQNDPFRFSENIILFGYSIDPQTGYPVTVQTRSEDLTIYDEDLLIEFILNRIEKKAVAILEIANENGQELGENAEF